MRTAAAGTVAAAAMIATLAACSPRGVGQIGVAKDAAGNLVVVTDGCGEELDFVTFDATRDGGPTGTAANGQLTYDRSGLGRFGLPDGQPRLTVIGRLDQLEPGTSYSTGSWDDDQSVRAGPISFRADDLADLPVGQVFEGRASQQSTDGSSVYGRAGSGDGELTVDRWLTTPCADKR